MSACPVVCFNRSHPPESAGVVLDPSHVCMRRKRIPVYSCSSLVVRDERSGEAGQGRVRPGEAFHVETHCSLPVEFSVSFHGANVFWPQTRLMICTCCLIFLG